MDAQLMRYCDSGIISAGDLAASRLLIDVTLRNGATEPSELAVLLVCIALRTQRDRHTCVDLDRIEDWGPSDSGPKVSLHWPRDAQTWLAAAASSPHLFGKPGEVKPLIIDGNRVYLSRSYSEETAIAAGLTRNNSKHLSIILGGPGTGKTSTVAERLIKRLSEGDNPRIALVAPTGKASARMRDVLLARCRDIGSSEAVMGAVDAATSSTVHSLLGYNPQRSPRFKYCAKNKLSFDWVVVDETSMMSASLMFRLLDALDESTELLLVGDPGQLASVDAGSVLADIASIALREGSILNSRTVLKENQFRFPTGSDIELFAQAVRNGDSKAAMAVLDGSLTRITWVDPAAKDGRKRLAELERQTIAHAQAIAAAALGNKPELALKLRLDFQVLCAHRNGQHGVSHWNALVENGLGSNTDHQWYIGRPVMVNRNNHAIKLYNGDVGITVKGNDDHPAVVFGDEKEHRVIATSRLDDVETVHALTIHKSQGSEFDHPVVILPNESSRILTRELLYTGITRAKSKLTIVGTRKVIESAIETAVRRASGLANRL